MNAITKEISLNIVEGKVSTTSNHIAEHFGKRHDTVLRAIANLDCSPEFHLRNFVEVSREVDAGNGAKVNYKSYTITRDGFTFLCMGFTGKDAAAWKEKYISAFNAMEAELKARPTHPTLKALPNGLTLEQQDSIKALVKARVESCPKDKQAKAAITCWSAIKSKYGVSYKAVPAEEYTEVLSLVARLPLEGEVIPANEPAAIAPPARRWIMSIDHRGQERLAPIPHDAVVMTHGQMVDALTNPEGILMTASELVDVALASIMRLKNVRQPGLGMV